MDANMVLALGLGIRPPWATMIYMIAAPWETCFNPLETSKNPNYSVDDSIAEVGAEIGERADNVLQECVLAGVWQWADGVEDGVEIDWA